MAHNLFEYITYDLDKQRIVDFRLKAWASRFLVLRSELYLGNDLENKNDFASERRNVPPTGLKDLPRRHIETAVLDLLYAFFGHRSPDFAPKSILETRNRSILTRFLAGESTDELAREFGISRQRVYQIIHAKS